MHFPLIYLKNQNALFFTYIIHFVVASSSWIYENRNFDPEFTFRFLKKIVENELQKGIK